MSNINDLFMKMIAFDAGDAVRIQHFTKVYTYAHLIAMQEGLDQAKLRILDAAALLHDIAIVPCEKNLGYCNGKIQEEFGPVYAKPMLEELGEYDEEEIDRILYLIAHHHTYTNVDGVDYRILLEADFLVNALEDNMSIEAVKTGKKNIFRSSAAIDIIDEMFALYRFFGWEGAKFRPSNENYSKIRNVRALYDILEDVWCADTCALRMRENWNDNNKTLGQCSITAFLVQDIFGGDVYGIDTANGNLHCFNIIDGVSFDLTSEQFDYELDYSGARLQKREEHFAKEEKYERYCFLKKRVGEISN